MERHSLVDNLNGGYQQSSQIQQQPHLPHLNGQNHLVQQQQHHGHGNGSFIGIINKVATGITTVNNPFVGKARLATLILQPIQSTIRPQRSK